MLDTGRLFATLRSLRAEVAETGGNGDKVHVDLLRAGGNELIDLNAAHALPVVMFLFAGYLAGMAAGAPIILYQ
jgi:hypothetical protein